MPMSSKSDVIPDEDVENLPPSTLPCTNDDCNGLPIANSSTIKRDNYLKQRGRRKWWYFNRGLQPISEVAEIKDDNVKGEVDDCPVIRNDSPITRDDLSDDNTVVSCNQANLPQIKESYSACLKVIEKFQEVVIDSAVRVIQAAFKRFRERRRFLRIKKAVVVIQRNLRKWLQAKHPCLRPASFDRQSSDGAKSDEYRQSIVENEFDDCDIGEEHPVRSILNGGELESNSEKILELDDSNSEEMQTVGKSEHICNKYNGLENMSSEHCLDKGELDHSQLSECYADQNDMKLQTTLDQENQETDKNSGQNNDLFITKSCERLNENSEVDGQMKIQLIPISENDLTMAQSEESEESITIMTTLQEELSTDMDDIHVDPDCDVENIQEVLEEVENQRDEEDTACTVDIATEKANLPTALINTCSDLCVPTCQESERHEKEEAVIVNPSVSFTDNTEQSTTEPESTLPKSLRTICFAILNSSGSSKSCVPTCEESKRHEKEEAVIVNPSATFTDKTETSTTEPESTLPKSLRTICYAILNSSGSSSSNNIENI